MKIVIAHFNTHWVNTAGGVEKVTCELANVLAEHGHEVTILYRDRSEGKPAFPLSSTIKTYNILFRKGKKVISEKLPLGLRIFREISRIISQKEAQAINARFKGKQYGSSIKRFLRDLKPELIITTSAPSTKYVIDDAECHIPVITMIHNQPEVQFAPLSDLERKAVSKSAAIQILLPSGLETAKQYFPKTNIYAIGNPISPSMIPLDLLKKKPQYVISCVGSVCDRKNQKFLVDAFEKLSHEFPNWQVQIWGSFDTVYGKAVKQQIEKRHLEKQVKLMGTTKDVEHDIYEKSDVFCMPSKGEGFPLALSEAMAAGLPTIGFKNSPGVNGLIKDGETGFLTEETIPAYAEALKILMNDPSLRKKMGDAGKREMEQYTPDKWWKQWEMLIADVIQGK